MDPAKIKKLFLQDWQSKLVSLLLAAGLWFYVNYLKNQMEYSFTVPLRFENLPQDMTVVYSSLKNAHISMNIRRDLKDTRDFSKDIKVWVDLADASIGEAVYPIQMEVSDQELSLKPHLKFDQVSLIIDKKINKSLPVKVKLLGTPHSGFMVEEVLLEEKVALLSGSSQRLSVIDSIETSPLDISQATNNLKAILRLNNPEFTSVLSKQTINVEVIIRENLQEKNLEIPVKIINLSRELKPAQTYKVKANVVYNSQHQSLAENLHLEADAGLIKEPGTYNLKLEKIPPEIQIESFSGYIQVELLTR